MEIGNIETSEGNTILYFGGLDEDTSKGDLTEDVTPAVRTVTIMAANGNTFNTTQLDNPAIISDISQVQILEQDVNPVSEMTILQEEKKKGWPKGRKRKKQQKDINAPKQPLTGYVRFLNERRDEVRAANPKLSFSEVSKLMGREWTNLPHATKQYYLDEAERDKEHYLKELEAYHQTDTYKQFKLLQEKSRKEETEESTVASVTETSVVDIVETGQISTFDIPIFTEEFLDHNKARESELRQMRIQNTEYEEQNAVLTKHIENMKGAINKLEADAVQTRTTNTLLCQHLDQLRQQLVSHFGSIALPGNEDPLTVESIDSYMVQLHQVILDSPQDNETLIAAVREIVGKLNVGFESEKL